MSEKDEQAIAAFMDNQFERTVEYTDSKGDKKTRKITLQDPGFDIASQAIDALNVGEDTGDAGRLFDLIMHNVLVNPHMDYESLNADVPDDIKKKTITKKNRSGKDVHINMVWPGYRTALQIVFMSTRPSGASNMNGTMTKLNSEVFRTDKNEVLKMNFWDATGDGSGLGMIAMQEATKFLAEITDRNGDQSVLGKAFQFLMESLQQVKL